MADRLRRVWQAGGTVINGWLAIPNGFTAELMAGAGWDSILIDLQHGVQDYMSMVHCLQACQAHPAVPLVRVPWNEPGIIGKALDAGAAGIVCPMINTPSQALAFVAACRYPPDGHRSNGPIRAGLYAEGYQATANARTLCIPMVETAQAVGNLGAILDVPGVDAVYVGPSDLGFSMGLPPILDREEPAILDIYAQIIRETARRGQVAGVHCLTAAYARRAIGMGFKLVTVGSDSLFVSQGARAAVAAVRAG